MNQDYKDLLSVFQSHGVKYLVVAGFAVIYHSQPRFTKDIDLFIQSDPEKFRDMQLEAARQAGEGWKMPLPPTEAMAMMVRDEDRDWVTRQCTEQPLATHQQPLHLTGAIDRIEKVAFILADGYSPSLFPPFYEKAKAKGWKTITMSCGHDVMPDMPEELTSVLLAVLTKGDALVH